MSACRAGWIAVVIAVMALTASHCHAAGAGSIADGPISVLADASGAAPSAIVAGEMDARFQPLPGKNYIPKYNEYDVWLRIQVPAAASDEPRVLTIARLPLESLSLFRRGASTQAPVWEDAFFNPPATAEFFTTAFAYRLPPDTAAGAVYYLHSRDLDPSQVIIDLSTQRDFDALDRRFTAFLSFVLAILVAMALSNFVFFVALRDRAYLYYVGFIASLIAFVAVAQDLPYHVAWLAWTGVWTSHAGAITGSTMGVFSTLFCQRFVESARFAPRMHRVLTALTLAFVVVAVASLFAWHPSITVFRQSTNFLLLILAAAQFVVGVIAWRRGSRAAGYFLLAWATPIVGTGLRAVGAAGIVPLTPLLVNAFLLSEALQALILSIGLADRTRELRRQRDRAHGLHEQAESRLRLEQLRHSELEHRASVDPLTGVLNRGRCEAEFTAALTAANRSGSALAILFIDVDHFKQVNDTHGHVVGDLCLALVARRIRESLGSDYECGRYGGEEFLVILPGATLDDACAIAERTRVHVGAEPIPAGAARVSVQVSIGVAEYRSGETAAALLDRADQALYAAKKNGRNRVMPASAA
jgi:diguanylate cyclase (GGDEF)-like protein